jgi:hypothetical protein
MPDFTVEDREAIRQRGAFLIDKGYLFGQKGDVFRFRGRDVVFFFWNEQPPYDDAQSTITFFETAETFEVGECAVAFSDFREIWPECTAREDILLSLDFIEKHYDLVTSREWCRTMRKRWDDIYRRSGRHGYANLVEFDRSTLDEWV